jgi:hypothetical protein
VSGCVFVCFVFAVVVVVVVVVVGLIFNLTK